MSLRWQHRPPLRVLAEPHAQALPAVKGRLAAHRIRLKLQPLVGGSAAEIEAPVESLAIGRPDRGFDIFESPNRLLHHFTNWSRTTASGWLSSNSRTSTCVAVQATFGR